MSKSAFPSTDPEFLLESMPGDILRLSGKKYQGLHHRVSLEFETKNRFSEIDFDSQ